jgi:hypothetical protein
VMWKDLPSILIGVIEVARNANEVLVGSGRVCF